MTQIYKPTFFVDDAALAGRAAEVPNAVFNSGMLGGGGAGPGIGINIDGGSLEPERLSNWTLLDQFGNARQAQIGQNIGGAGWVDRSSTDWPSSGGDEGTAPDSTIRALADSSAESNGELTLPAEGAWLADLATGWQEDPTP